MKFVILALLYVSMGLLAIFVFNAAYETVLQTTFIFSEYLTGRILLGFVFFMGSIERWWSKKVDDFLYDYLYWVWSIRERIKEFYLSLAPFSHRRNQTDKDDTFTELLGSIVGSFIAMLLASIVSKEFAIILIVQNWGSFTTRFNKLVGLLKV